MIHSTKGAASAPIFQSISWEETMDSQFPMRGKANAMKTITWRKRFVPPKRRPRGTQSIQIVQRRPSVKPYVSIVFPNDNVAGSEIGFAGTTETWDFLIGSSLAGTMLVAKTGNFDDDISDITPWSTDDENNGCTDSKSLSSQVVTALGMSVSVRHALEERMGD